MLRVDFRAMGCQMLALVDSEDRTSADRLAAVSEWFEAWEGRLSRFRGTSELSRLNARAGEPQRVSPVLLEVFRASLQAAAASGGLVVPTVLPALEVAGYDRSFEGLGDRPPRGESGTCEPVGNWRKIGYDRRRRTIHLPVGFRLDFGGVAKGWAADRAVGRLKSMGPALVDAGGDVAVSGPRADGQPWPIGVASPFDPEEETHLLMIRRGGVATSGRDFRRWRQAGVWQHHIIDPRSGCPAQTDVLTATVLGPSALQADVAAKVAVILGSREGLRWLETRRRFAGILVLEDGRILLSRRMRDHLWRD